MNVQIEVSPETAQLLAARAAERRLALDAYLHTLAAADATPAVNAQSELAEFDRDMDALAAGLPELPVLPPDFSRLDLYAEHD
jgi:hypothetical protein